MSELTTQCIYCGKTLVGEVYHSNTMKSAIFIERVAGTISSLSNGDVYHAYKYVTGSPIKRRELLMRRIFGGINCHFNCPYCNQEFQKVI